MDGSALGYKSRLLLTVTCKTGRFILSCGISQTKFGFDSERLFVVVVVVAAAAACPVIVIPPFLASVDYLHNHPSTQKAMP